VRPEIEPKQTGAQELPDYLLHFVSTLRALGVVDRIDFGGNLHKLPRSNYSIHYRRK